MLGAKTKYYFAKLMKKMQTPAIKDSKIHKTSKVCSGSHIVRSKVDRYSYIGNNSTIVNSRIGAFCSIADFCIIGGASHPIDFVSTSPVFLEGKNVLRTNFSHMRFDPFEETKIENDVWVGAGVLIKAGITISNGSVIGMGSVVTHDVGPYEIWGGNPAKFIKKRFDDETVNELLSSKWWSMDDNIIRGFAKYSSDPTIFLTKIKQHI